MKLVDQYRWDFKIRSGHYDQPKKLMTYKSARLYAWNLANVNRVSYVALRKHNGADLTRIYDHHGQAAAWQDVVHLSPPDLPPPLPDFQAPISEYRTPETQRMMRLFLDSEPGSDDDGDRRLMRQIARTEDCDAARAVVQRCLSAFYREALCWIREVKVKGQPYKMTPDYADILLACVAPMYHLMIERPERPAAYTINRVARVERPSYIGHLPYPRPPALPMGWDCTCVTQAMAEAVCDFTLNPSVLPTLQAIGAIVDCVDGYWIPATQSHGEFIENGKGVDPEKMRKLAPYFSFHYQPFRLLCDLILGGHGPDWFGGCGFLPPRIYRDRSTEWPNCPIGGILARLREPHEWAWYLRVALYASIAHTKLALGHTPSVYAGILKLGLVSIQTQDSDLYKPQSLIRIDHMDWISDAEGSEAARTRAAINRLGIVARNRFKPDEYDEFCFPNGHLSYSPSAEVRRNFNLPEI